MNRLVKNGYESLSAMFKIIYDHFVLFHNPLKLVSNMLQILKAHQCVFGLIVAGVFGTLTGCSCESEPQILEAKRTQNTTSSKVKAPKKRSVKRKQQRKKTVKETQPEIVGNPDDQFEVMDYVHNFKIQKTPTNNDSKDQFAVVLPAREEVDSTSFVILKNATQDEQNKPDSSFELPDGFSAVEEAGYSDRGLPNRIRCEKDYSEMVLVPVGVSTQGTNEGEKNEAPQFVIYQNDFYIDVHEVTLEQYRRWRSEMIGKKGKVPNQAMNNSQPADFPALGIFYSDALNYARTMGKQLPLETQWEKAARGETGFLYPWGNGRPLWSKNRKLGQIDSVRSFSGDLSPYGVFDLSGNAREWCRDWYSEKSYQGASRFADAGVVRKWTGPKRAVVPSTRVVRGNQNSWEVTRRAGENMRTPSADVGFRCVLNLPEASEDSESTKETNSF